MAGGGCGGGGDGWLHLCIMYRRKNVVILNYEAGDNWKQRHILASAGGVELDENCPSRIPKQPRSLGISATGMGKRRRGGGDSDSSGSLGASD